MIVAACQIALFLPACGSLKEKRSIIKSLQARIRQKYNVSIAEVDDQDKWQRAVLGLSFVTTDRKITDTTYQRILDFIESDGRSQLLDYVIEFY